MLKILFVSDYVCPYCFVAKEALKQALQETKLEAEIIYQPFELTTEPQERIDTYSDEKKRAGYQVLVEPCKKLGLNMKLPPKVIPRPYTRLAFEGWYYAKDRNLGDDYNNLIYNAYFVDEKDIGDVEVLGELVQSIGLDKEDYKKALLKGTYSEVEKEAIAYTKNVIKPEYVPTIYINDKKVNIKDYTKEEMVDLLFDCVSAKI